nr:NADH dehydrogenase subunit 6 [Acinopterus sp.]
MKIIIMKILIMVSSSLPFLKAPMSMGLALLMQTILISILTAKVMQTSWMAMIMFLMMVGGLLILFMYMSSISSNEKFKPSIKLMITLMLIMVPMEEMILSNQMETFNENTFNELPQISKMYNKLSNNVTWIMFMYLFLAMISVTKLVSIHKGPLRAKKS